MQNLNNIIPEQTVQQYNCPIIMKHHQIYDYIIIGAGLAGLQSALVLAEHYHKFIILQATSIIGGRVATQTIQQIIEKEQKQPSQGIVHPVPNWISQNKHILQIPIDYGATWIAQNHKYMLNLLQQFNIQAYPQFRDGSYIYGVQPGKYQFLPDLKSHFNAEKLSKIKKLIKRIHSIKQKFDFLYQQAIEKKNPNKLPQYNQFITKYDQISVQTFVNSQINDDNELCGELMNFIECLQCISCDKFSMMQLLQDVQSGLQIVYEAVGQLEEPDDGFRIKTGMSSLIKKMYQKLFQIVKKHSPNIQQHNIIRFNEPVVRILTSKNQEDLCKIYTKHKNGIRIYAGKVVLNSIPLATMNKIQITNLSQGRKLLYHGQQMGKVTRTFMIFREPFWRKQFHGYGLFSSKFPFNQMTELSPANLQCGIFAFVFYGDKYQKWINNNPNPQQRFTFLKTVVADMFLDGDTNSELLKSCYSYTRSYQTHEYIKAAYQPTTRMKIWKQIQDIKQEYGDCYSKDENGILNIGSQFSEEYGSFMEGAIRVARNKTYRLIHQKDPWKQ